jgi:hypothetical protein
MQQICCIRPDSELVHVFGDVDDVLSGFGSESDIIEACNCCHASWSRNRVEILEVRMAGG